MAEPPAIGVDFDNTIVSYDELFRELAQERGLLEPGLGGSKLAIRDALRARPGGEEEWQELQGAAYGPRIGQAGLIRGVRDFFQACRERGIKVFIVSHKTELAARDETRTNLCRAALGWLEANGFFGPEGLGLAPGDVFFEPSRAGKIERIGRLGLSAFIDDLVETFVEPGWPPQVRRILYDPHGRSDAPPGVEVLADWPAISRRLLGAGVEAGEGGLAADFGRLLGRPVSGLERLGRGGNSRVFRLTGPDGASFFGKAYFRHPADGRDRLGVEFAAFQFLRASGLDQVPRPLAADRLRGLAAYEFIQGRAVPGEEVGPEDIDAAIEFLLRLRDLAGRPEAQALPAASEAFFSLAGILANLEARLARLRAVPAGPGPGTELGRFLDGEFGPALERLRDFARQRYARLGRSVEAELEPAERTLSPSDFGFHNALRRVDGRLVWCDFEYFGWDDPAKTAADFLLHPAMDLDLDSGRRFVRGLLAGLGQADLGARLEALYPLFGLKWCLILLNEFISAERLRRGFAAGRAGESSRVLARQMAKARRMLERILSQYERFPYFG